MTRDRLTELQYAKHKKLHPNDGSCGFCNLPENEIKETFSFFTVALNLFPYSFWDSTDVSEHYMLVPKRHVTSMSDLTQEELIEYAQLVAKFEGEGFSIYSRGHNSHMKSVAHQHTHLIKLGNKRKRFVLFSWKPYFRFAK